MGVKILYLMSGSTAKYSHLVLATHQQTFQFKPFHFLSDPGVPGVRSMGPDVTQSVHTRGFADLTDVTLADEDSNSTPADDVNGQSQAM